MHLYRVVDLPGRDDEALANVMRHMLRLGWDIEASAPLWARAKTGSWWEKKVEVEVVAGGGTLAIDAEPVSSLGVGPAWRAKVQEAVDELAAALGVAPEPATERPQPSKPFFKLPMNEQDYDSRQWDEVMERATEAAPAPATPPQQMTLPMQAQGGGGGGRGRVGEALWWVVKEVGGAIIAIATGKALEGDADTRSQKGKLEYNLASNQMLVRWKDGSTTLAPKEYQPRGS